LRTGSARSQAQGVLQPLLYFNERITWQVTKFFVKPMLLRRCDTLSVREAFSIGFKGRSVIAMGGSVFADVGREAGGSA